MQFQMIEKNCGEHSFYFIVYSRYGFIIRHNKLRSFFIITYYDTSGQWTIEHTCKVHTYSVQSVLRYSVLSLWHDHIISHTEVFIGIVIIHSGQLMNTVHRFAVIKATVTHVNTNESDCSIFSVHFFSICRTYLSRIQWVCFWTTLLKLFVLLLIVCVARIQLILH